MKSERKNVVDVSGNLKNSPVTVHQNQDGVQSINNQHIEYVIDDATVRAFSKKAPEQMRNFFYIALAVSSLGILADIVGLLAYIGVQKWQAVIFLVPMCIFFAILVKDDLWLTSLDADSSEHFRDGLWYQRLPDGNFVSYLKRAKCIYPKCNGLVQIVPAPPREKGNHSLVGKCSVDGRRHTYTVDSNGIGYAQRIRLDRASEASHDLNRLLDKPVYWTRHPIHREYLFLPGRASEISEKTVGYEYSRRCLL